MLVSAQQYRIFWFSYCYERIHGDCADTVRLKMYKNEIENCNFIYFVLALT